MNALKNKYQSDVESIKGAQLTSSLSRVFSTGCLRNSAACSPSKTPLNERTSLKNRGMHSAVRHRYAGLIFTVPIISVFSFLPLSFIRPFTILEHSLGTSSVPFCRFLSDSPRRFFKSSLYLQHYRLSFRRGDPCGFLVATLQHRL